MREDHTSLIIRKCNQTGCTALVRTALVRSQAKCERLIWGSIWDATNWCNTLSKDYREAFTLGK